MALYASQDTNIRNFTAKRKFLQAIAFTTTSSFTALNTTFPDGTKVPAHPLIVVQADADANYTVDAAAAVATLTNSTWLVAGQLDKVTLSQTDTGINVRGRAATGNLMVFVLDASNT